MMPVWIEEASLQALPKNESPESFAPALRRYFGRRASRWDVDDLVQDVLVRMQGRRSEVGILHMQGYVFAVAANVLRESRRKVISFQEFEGEALELTDGITPERIVGGVSDVACLMAAIDSLPPRTREIFVAHRFEEMTYAAIASLYGISVSAVEKRIMAALKLLTVAVKGDDGRGETADLPQRLERRQPSARTR